MNEAALEAYANCSNAAQVAALHESYIEAAKQKADDKLRKKASERIANGIGGYMDDMDLPPSDGEDYEEEEEEEDEDRPTGLEVERNCGSVEVPDRFG